MHYLDNIVQVCYRLVMLFWWGWQYTIDVLYCHCVPPFICGVDRSHLFTMGLVENLLKVAHVLRSVVFCLQSRMSSLKVDFCDKRLIPLDTIISSEIVCPPACANYTPFSNCLIKRARGSAGSQGSISFTAFSSRSISYIAP